MSAQSFASHRIWCFAWCVAWFHASRPQRGMQACSLYDHVKPTCHTTAMHLFSPAAPWRSEARRETSAAQARRSRARLPAREKIVHRCCLRLGKKRSCGFALRSTMVRRRIRARAAAGVWRRGASLGAGRAPRRGSLGRLGSRGSRGSLALVPARRHPSRSPSRPAAGLRPCRRRAATSASAPSGTGAAAGERAGRSRRPKARVRACAGRTRAALHRCCH